MPDFLPLRLLLVTFAGWIDREQASGIDYLTEEDLAEYVAHYNAERSHEGVGNELTRPAPPVCRPARQGDRSVHT